MPLPPKPFSAISPVPWTSFLLPGGAIVRDANGADVCVCVANGDIILAETNANRIAVWSVLASMGLL